MKKFMILIIFLMVTIATHAQEPQNYVIIERPSRIWSAPLMGRGTIKHIVRASVDDVTLAVTGRNFEGDRVCTGLTTDRGLWLRVDLFGIEGWIGFCKNDFVGDITTVPVVIPPEPELHSYFDPRSELDQLGDAPLPPYVIGRTLVNRINLREEADITSARIDILTSDEIYVVGWSADRAWLKVRYNGVVAHRGWGVLGNKRVDLEGWVAGFLLDLPDGWQDIIPVLEN